MSIKVRNVGEYLRELEKTKAGRPDQVKEGLELYIELWRKAIERGAVQETQTVDEALERIEREGGLYAAAGEAGPGD